MMFGLVSLVALGWLALYGYLPDRLFVFDAVCSTLLFSLYGFDKSAARRGARRLPERTLHFFSVIGGWPGASIGQQVFRHKRQKTSFLLTYWTTVVINGLLTGWLWVWPAVKQST